MCFNPDAGEMCCQDGSKICSLILPVASLPIILAQIQQLTLIHFTAYCGEGSRCTDNGCCDKDDSLDQCDAKKDTEFKATSSQKPITVTKTISKDRPTTIVAEETTAGMLTTTGSLPTETSDEDDGEGSGTGPSRSKSTTNVGAIAGGVVGGVAVVAASIVAGVWLFLRHKRRMAAAKPQEDADDNVDNNKSTKRPLMEYFKPSVPPEDPPALAELPVTAGGAHHIDGKPVYEMDGGAGINNNADTSTNTTAPLAAPAVNNNGNLPLR